MRPTPTDSDSEYETPSHPTNVTDYALEFTSQGVKTRNRRIVNPNQPSTSRAAAEAAKKGLAEVSRGRHAPSRKQQSKSKQTETSSERRSARVQSQGITQKSPVREQSSQTPKAHRRKQRQPLSSHLRINREIQRLRNFSGFLIPKAPFGRLVREIMMGSGSGQVTFIMATALETIHEMAEHYLTQILSDAYMLTLHRNRVTLLPKDIQLLRLIKLID